MGCDINAYIEVRINGKWRPKSAGWRNVDWFINKPPKYELGAHEFDIDRNHVLFGILSNTTNIYGVPYISQPREIPNDIHPITKRVVDYAIKYYGDEDNLARAERSWVTLAELKKYWEKYGILRIEGYLNLAYKHQFNFETSGDLTSFGVGKELESYHNPEKYMKGTWYSSICYKLIDDLEQVLRFDDLQSLSPEDVRLVFWYDK